MLDFSCPDHMDDIAPPAAAALMQCGKRGLSWLFSHDYQLVLPPLADYIETLTGGDEALNLQTFKMTDALSGRTLGIRADQTPQIARFDAALKNPPPQRRYCYLGPALRALPPQPWQEREMLQLGAELFGAPPGGGDWEIAAIALGTLRACGAEDLAIDLGHAGLFAAAVEDLPPPLRQTLTGLVAARNAAGVDDLAAAGALPPHTAKTLRQLMQGGGGYEGGDDGGLAAAARLAAEGGGAGAAAVPAAADALRFVYARLREEGYDTALNLSELGSYGYHSGVVFNIYGGARFLARGGRYARQNGDDGCGFSVDLRALADFLKPQAAAAAVNVPLAPHDAAWRAAVQGLRDSGRRLRFCYEGDDDGAAPLPALCRDKEAGGKEAGGWRVREK